jgi:hypothetical protein
MKLDFSVLDSITADNIKPQEQEQAKAYHKIDKQKQQQEEAFKIHKETADNISRSQHLRAEINKDITAGADTHSILLKALKCIELMTGDTVFNNVNKDKLEREQKTA